MDLYSALSWIHL